MPRLWTHSTRPQVTWKTLTARGFSTPPTPHYSLVGETQTIQAKNVRAFDPVAPIHARRPICCPTTTSVRCRRTRVRSDGRRGALETKLAYASKVDLSGSERRDGFDEMEIVALR